MLEKAQKCVFGRLLDVWLEYSSSLQSQPPTPSSLSRGMYMYVMQLAVNSYILTNNQNF